MTASACCGPPLSTGADAAWRVEAAHHEAFIQVTKIHFEVPAILSVYDQLARWIAAPGRKRAGSPREVYTAGVEPLFAGTDEHVCDVAMPFRNADLPVPGRPDPRRS
jgi:hypothetical protein